MTAFLKNRKAAAAITLVLCALFLVLGMNRSVSAQADKYTRAFYDGVRIKGEDYTSAALFDILGSCSNWALTLSSIYADYPALEAEVEALTWARRSLVDAMDAKDIPAMYSAYRQLGTAADALEKAAADVQVTYVDSEKAIDAAANLRSAMGAAAQNPYNEYVEEYYARVAKTLPMRLLGFAVFADGPDFFALEEL